jgi:hypothetical protein
MQSNSNYRYAQYHETQEIILTKKYFFFITSTVLVLKI